MSLCVASRLCPTPPLFASSSSAATVCLLRRSRQNSGAKSRCSFHEKQRPDNASVSGAVTPAGSNWASSGVVCSVRRWTESSDRPIILLTSWPVGRPAFSSQEMILSHRAVSITLPSDGIICRGPVSCSRQWVLCELSAVSDQHEEIGGCCELFCLRSTGGIVAATASHVSPGITGKRDGSRSASRCESSHASVCPLA